MRKSITPDHTRQAYQLAKDVYKGKLDIKTAQDKLEDAEMGRNSAGDYVRAFLRMMEGECYKRTINEYSTEHYLKMICADFGQRYLSKALSSVEQHIEYYEKQGHGKLPSIRAIHRKFSKKL